MKGTFPPTYVFQGGERLCLFQIVLLCKVEETHVSLKRKPSVLESGASSPLIPCGKGVSFSKK
jgi:hypothetical protein